MSTEENKAVVRRWREEVFNQKNLTAFDESFDSDCIVHGFPPDVPANREGAKHFMGSYVAAFPDLKSTIEDMIAEGDKVVQRFSSIGTQHEAFMGIPASGKRVTFTGIDIMRMADGKVCEMWHETDSLGVLLQLGVIPMPER